MVIVHARNYFDKKFVPEADPVSQVYFDFSIFQKFSE